LSRVAVTLVSLRQSFTGHSESDCDFCFLVFPFHIDIGPTRTNDSTPTHTHTHTHTLHFNRRLHPAADVADQSDLLHDSGQHPPPEKPHGHAEAGHQCFGSSQTVDAGMHICICLLAEYNIHDTFWLETRSFSVCLEPCMCVCVCVCVFFFV